MVGELRAGHEVIVPDLETARALLQNMPDVRPQTEHVTGKFPIELQPTRTYRGDLVNIRNPAGSSVHEPGTSRPAHERNLHYNIIFPNGETAAILIVPK
jgi:hypothetical protein